MHRPATGTAQTRPRPCQEAPVRGTGIGLRAPHVERILTELPSVPWFEILADNYTGGGLPARHLTAVRAHYPVTLHCVGMSIGATTPLDMTYLRRIKRLIGDIEPAWVSDHVCFTRHGRHEYHDLLPLPYTVEALDHVSDRILRIQDFLGRQILVENVSSYLRYRHSTLDEPSFIAALAQRADCGLLLDLNNVYVNQVNHGLSAQRYYEALPADRIREIHLAGYEDRGAFLIDAHNNPVSAPVWDLYRTWRRLLPEVPTLIEWDNAIPSLDRLLAEAARAEACSVPAPELESAP